MVISPSKVGLRILRSDDYELESQPVHHGLGCRCAAGAPQWRVLPFAIYDRHRQSRITLANRDASPLT